MKFLVKLSTIFDHTLDLSATGGFVLLAIMMFSVCFEILVRNILGRSQLWLMEINEIFLLYITFLAAAWVLRREGHVKMDLLLSRLDPRVQTIVNIITSIIGIVICFVFTWYGAKVTWSHFLTGQRMPTALEIPYYPILLIIPIGSFLLFIQFLRRTHGYFQSWKTPK